MKAILLAASEDDSRLYPLTRRMPKELLPVYNKPLIYYALSNLMLAGIREILVMAAPQSLPALRDSLGEGTEWGMQVQYASAARQPGMLAALAAARQFCDGQPVAISRSDTILYGRDMADLLREFASLRHGAAMFAYSLREQGVYSLVSLDPEDRPLRLNDPDFHEGMLYSVPGIYFYDQRAPELAQALIDRQQGKARLDDLNQIYLDEGTLRVVILGRGIAWLDAATPEGLLQSANFIQVIEERQGFMIACPEEIAYREGMISREALLRSAQGSVGQYGDYLRRIAEEEQVDSRPIPGSQPANTPF